jgi:exopolysaccharide biosynthesis operon protein EpsL
MCNRTTFRRSGGALLAILGTGLSGLALAASLPREEGDPLRVQLSHTMTQDSNLYRLPDNLEVTELMPGARVSRDDLVNRTSAALDAGWELGKQAFAFDASVDANRYADNTDLDNTSANSRLDWNWQLGRHFSGQLGGGYGRSLSGFVNSRFLGRDVLETSDYHGAARYQLTPRWSLRAQGRLAEGEHDTLARQQDNFESRSGTFGVAYLTRRGDEVGLEYRRTATDFPNEIQSNPLIPITPLFESRRYIDRQAHLNLRYAFTVKTSLQTSAGYVWRHYPEGVFGDFAGPVWNAALSWEPRAKTRIGFGLWRELKAYVDSESSYFESSGARVTVAWLPASRLTVSLEFSDERHDYSGFDSAFLTEAPRRDSLQSARVSLTWRPMPRLAFDLTGGVEERDSNRPSFDFDDRTASASLRLIF